MTDSHTMERPKRKAAAVTSDHVKATLNSNNRKASGDTGTMGTIVEDGQKKIISGERESSEKVTDREKDSTNVDVVKNANPQVEDTSETVAEIDHRPQFTDPQDKIPQLTADLEKLVREDPIVKEPTPQVVIEAQSTKTNPRKVSAPKKGNSKVILPPHSLTQPTADTPETTTSTPNSSVKKSNAKASLPPHPATKKIVTATKTGASTLDPGKKKSASKEAVSEKKTTRRASAASCIKTNSSPATDSTRTTPEPPVAENTTLQFAESVIDAFKSGSAKKNTSDPAASQEIKSKVGSSQQLNTESTIAKVFTFPLTEKLIADFKAKHNLSNLPSSQAMKVQADEFVSTTAQLVGALKITVPAGRSRASSQSGTQSGVAKSPVKNASTPRVTDPKPSTLKSGTRKTTSKATDPQNLTPKTDSPPVPAAHKSTPQALIHSSPQSNHPSSPPSSLKPSSLSPPSIRQERESKIPLIKQVGQNQIAQKKKMEGNSASSGRGRSEKRKEIPDFEERSSKKQNVDENEVASKERTVEEVEIDDDATISDGPTPRKEEANNITTSVDNQTERRSSRERRPVVPRGASPVARVEATPLQRVWHPVSRSQPNSPVASPRIQSQKINSISTQLQIPGVPGVAAQGQVPAMRLPAPSLTTPQSQAQSQHQATQSPESSVQQRPAQFIQDLAQSRRTSSPNLTSGPRTLTKPKSRIQFRSQTTTHQQTSLRLSTLREQEGSNLNKPKKPRQPKASTPEQTFDHFQIDRPRPQGPILGTFSVVPQGQKRARPEVDDQPNPAANSTRGTGQVQQKTIRKGVSTAVGIQAQVHRNVTSANPRRYEDIASLQHISQEAQVQQLDDLGGLERFLKPNRPDKTVARARNNTSRKGTTSEKKDNAEEPAKKKIRYDSGDCLGLFRELEREPAHTPEPYPSLETLLEKPAFDSLVEATAGPSFALFEVDPSLQHSNGYGTTWSLVGTVSIPGYSDILSPRKEVKEQEANSESNLNSAAAKIMNILREQFQKPKPPKERHPNQSIIPDFNILGIGKLQRVSDYEQDPELQMFPNEDEDISNHAPHTTSTEGCTFCLYSCDFGIADDRVMLPAEAFPGFCPECNVEPMEFYSKWKDSGKCFTAEARRKGHRFLERLDNLGKHPYVETQEECDFISQSEKITSRKIFGSVQERTANHGRPAKDVKTVRDIEYGSMDVTQWQAVQTCRGNPYGQVDCRKARICEECLVEKLDIIKHRRHTDLSPIVYRGEVDDIVDAWGEEIEMDPREKCCMICTAAATVKCDDCPLRVCFGCESYLKHMAKGYLNNLFYWFKRSHIRNDAFLLRSDGGGF